MPIEYPIKKTIQRTCKEKIVGYLYDLIFYLNLGPNLKMRRDFASGNRPQAFESAGQELSNAFGPEFGRSLDEKIRSF